MNKQIEQIITLRKSGIMPMEIAKKLGIKDTQKVRAICYEYKVSESSNIKKPSTIFSLRINGSGDKVSFFINSEYYQKVSKYCKEKGLQPELFLAENFGKLLESIVNE